MDKNHLVNTFLEIVQIDSPTGHEDKMADWIFVKLKSLGLIPIRDRFGNVIAKISGPGSPILLTAHLDTVEPGRGIKPIIKNKTIKSYGNTILGADNKAAVAVILVVLETILGRSDRKCPIEVVFTLSEEIGNLGAVNLDYSLIESKEGFSFDAEGNVGTIITASPFYNRFDIKIIGKSAHAARPENAVNALLIVTGALGNLKLGRIDKDTICNIGAVEGGDVRNTVPGKMALMGEVRSFVEGKLEKATRLIIDEFEKSAKNWGGQIKYEIVRENGGYKLRNSDNLIRFALKAFNNLHIRPKFEESYGCADANIFADHGIKVLNLADGSKHPHTTKECISVDDLSNSADLLLRLVYQGYEF